MNPTSPKPLTKGCQSLFRTTLLLWLFWRITFPPPLPMYLIGMMAVLFRDSTISLPYTERSLCLETGGSQGQSSDGHSCIHSFHSQHPPHPQVLFVTSGVRGGLTDPWTKIWTGEAEKSPARAKATEPLWRKRRRRAPALGGFTVSHARREAPGRSRDETDRQVEARSLSPESR